jgi:hypothetical protein
MENKKENTKTKTTDNQTNNIKKSQNQNLPAYHSQTSHRDGSGLPAVENLNQTEGLKKPKKGVKKDDSDPLAPKNDKSLYGESTKTDPGAGKRDKDEHPDEKIIRT